MEDKNKKINSLEYVGKISQLIESLATAKVHEFIATAEAKNIISEILKATGLKTVQKPVNKPDIAQEKEVKE